MKKQYRVLYSFEKMADAEFYLNDKKNIGKVDLFIEEDQTYYYSISPYNEILKADNEGDSSSGNSSEKGFKFPAHPDLDITIHKNRLLMNESGFAKLCNYSEGYPGVKGKFEVTVSAPIKTVGAIQELTFMSNLNENDIVTIPFVGSFQAKALPSAQNEFEIGINLNDTLSNLVNKAINFGLNFNSYSISGNTLISENISIYTGSQYVLPSTLNSGSVMDLNNTNFASVTRNGIDGGYATAYIELMTNTGDIGRIIGIKSPNGNQYIAINSIINNNVVPTSDYMNWNMANTDNEFAQILYNAFNSQGYFVASNLVGNKFEIEETVVQEGDHTFLDIFDYSIPLLKNTIEYPKSGGPMLLKKRVLGFLLDVVDGFAYISTSNVGVGVLANGINVSYSDNIDWSLGIEDLIQSGTILVPGIDGELIDFSTLFSLSHGRDFVEDLIVLGQVYLSLENKSGGETILVRPIKDVLP
jgi:hypothetical protein